jgi:hypothetical protein
LWIASIGAVLVVTAIVAWTAARKRRTEGLQEQFGPEYDRTISQTDTRREAEAELEARRARREELDIRPLTPAARDRYASTWTTVQSRFVDEPTTSLREADRLVADLMRERGYPMDDFEQRAADVSVDHPQVVAHYRVAHEISGRSESSTEDMRQGMIHYRALFEELLEVHPAAGPRD